MQEIELLLSVLIIGFSTLLLIVSIAAYIKIRNYKFLLISIAFIGFLIQGLLLFLEIISQNQIAYFIDILILLCLYFAVVKK